MSVGLILIIFLVLSLIIMTSGKNYKLMGYGWLAMILFIIGLIISFW